MDPKIFEYYNQNSLIKFPLAESADIIGNGITIPNNLFVDAIYYSNSIDVGILTIEINRDNLLVIVLTDSAKCQINLTTYELYTSIPIYLNNQDRGFFVFGEGISKVKDLFGNITTFTNCQIEKSCIILLPHIITSLGINGQETILKGDIGLLGQDGIKLTTIDNAIEISAIYDRSDCEPQSDNYLKTINNVSPDSHGNLVIEGNNLITVDDTTNGIVFQTLLGVDKLCPTRFEDGVQGPDGPTGPQGPGGAGGDCQIINPICCECEVCDTVEACALCENCNTCEKCNTCEQESGSPYCPFDQPICYPCDVEICSYQESIPTYCDFTSSTTWPQTYIIISGTITRDHLYLAPPTRTQFYYFDYVLNEFFAKFVIQAITVLNKTHDYVFKFLGFTVTKNAITTPFIFYARKPKMDLSGNNVLAFLTPYPYSEDYFEYYCDDDKNRILIYSDWYVPDGQYAFSKRLYVLWENGDIGILTEPVTAQCQILDKTDSVKSDIFNITLTPYEYAKTTNTSVNSYFRTQYQSSLYQDVFSLLSGEVISSNSWVENTSGQTCHKWLTHLCGPTNEIDLSNSKVIVYKDLCPYVGKIPTDKYKSVYCYFSPYIYEDHTNISFKEVVLSEINTPSSKTDLRKIKTTYLTYYYPYDAVFVRFKEKIKDGLYVERMHRLSEAYGTIDDYLTSTRNNIIYSENPIPTIKNKEIYFDFFGITGDESYSSDNEKNMAFDVMCKTGNYYANGSNKIKMYNSSVSDIADHNSSFLTETTKSITILNTNTYYSDIYRKYTLLEYLPCTSSSDKMSYYTDNFNIYFPIANNISDIRPFSVVEQTTINYTMSAIKLKYLVYGLNNSILGCSGWKSALNIYRVYPVMASNFCIIDICPWGYNSISIPLRDISDYNKIEYIYGINEQASSWVAKFCNTELNTKKSDSVRIITSPSTVLNNEILSRSNSAYSTKLPDEYYSYTIPGYYVHLYFCMNDGWVLLIYKSDYSQSWCYASQVRTLSSVGTYRWSHYTTTAITPLLGLNTIDINNISYTSDNTFINACELKNTFAIDDTYLRSNMQLDAGIKILETTNITPTVQTYKQANFDLTDIYNTFERTNVSSNFPSLTQPNDIFFQKGDPNNFITSVKIPLGVCGWADTRSAWRSIENSISVNTVRRLTDLNNNRTTVLDIQSIDFLQYQYPVFPLNCNVEPDGGSTSTRLKSRLVFTGYNINPTGTYKVKYYNNYDINTETFSGLISENDDVQFGGFIPGTDNLGAYLWVFTERTGSTKKSQYYGTLDTRLRQTVNIEIVETTDTNKKGYPYRRYTSPTITKIDMFLPWIFQNYYSATPTEYNAISYTDGGYIYSYIDAPIYGFNDESPYWEAYTAFLDPLEPPWPHTQYWITTTDVTYIGHGTHKGGMVRVPLTSSSWPGTSPGWYCNNVLRISDYGYNTTIKRGSSSNVAFTLT